MKNNYLKNAPISKIESARLAVSLENIKVDYKTILDQLT